MNGYTQSIENYKGFTLELVMKHLDNTPNCHRSCIVQRDGKNIARCKSKKEAKELINAGVLR